MFQNDLKRWRGTPWKPVPGFGPIVLTPTETDTRGFCVGESSRVTAVRHGEANGAGVWPTQTYLARYMKGKMVLIHHLSEWL